MKLIETGHDLFWWRCTAEGWRTLVTIYWPDVGQAAPARFEYRLFDDAGQLSDSWHGEQVQGSFVAIDSDHPRWAGREIDNGVLSVRVLQPEQAVPLERHRLYGTIDWYHPTQGLASLHSDHCVLTEPKPLELTEIVLRPAQQRRPFLVFITGEEAVAPAGLHLELANSAGHRRTAHITGTWLPFRVHRIDLAAHFGDLEAFAQGGELSLTGKRDATALFERPYVVSEEPTFTAYHGGDRYAFGPLAGIHHQLLGEGEVNPMLVVQNSELETEVNFFNSHGSLEEDFWVGVRLYDCAGKLVAHQPRWRLARRAGPTAARMAELVPRQTLPFAGHAAFTFSEAKRQAYPRRLQALMAYRSREACARIMAWSDEWNTPIRRYKLSRQRAGHYFSWYRLLAKPFAENWLAVTNAGSHDMSEACEYRIEVRGADGQTAIATRSLPPLGTDWARVYELVPGAAELMAHCRVVALVITSAADLAAVALVQHRERGVWSAEHLMSAPVLGNSGIPAPAGC